MPNLASVNPVDGIRGDYLACVQRENFFANRAANEITSNDNQCWNGQPIQEPVWQMERVWHPCITHVQVSVRQPRNLKNSQPLDALPLILFYCVQLWALMYNINRRGIQRFLVSWVERFVVRGCSKWSRPENIVSIFALVDRSGYSWQKILFNEDICLL